jgi:hypothetical protein
MARGWAIVIDITTNPRVSQLVGRIEELAAESPPVNEPVTQRAAREREVAELYVEMGRYVHWLMRQEPAAIARAAIEARRWATDPASRVPTVPLILARLAPPAADLSGARTDRVDRTFVAQPRVPVSASRDSDTSPSGSHASGTPSEFPSDPDALLDQVEPELLEDLEAISAEVEEADLVVEPLGEDGLDEPTDSIAPTAGVPQETAWIRDLNDLLSAVGAPETGPLDAAACASAASRLLNATTQMEVRWMGFPDSVQHGLLGLIACRARGLQQQMEVDVELRMALGRLRRFHGARQLQPVPALRDDGRPSSGSWARDAAQWWERLHAPG